MQRIERVLAALMTLALLSPPGVTAADDPPEDEIETVDSDEETVSIVDIEAAEANDDIAAAEVDFTSEAGEPERDSDSDADFDDSDPEEFVSERSDRDGPDPDDFDADANEDEPPVASDAPLEYDGEGYAVAAREVLALSSSDADRDIFQALGYTVTTREELPGLGLSLLSIGVPANSSAEAVLADLASRKSDSIYALNHIFAAGRLAKGTAAARGAQSALYPNAVVGIIDGAVAPGGLPVNVTLESASFAAAKPATNDHGSAVAALLADAGVSHVYAADIFNGRHASAAAMIRALDWMADREVPVINISLAGPPNSIVHRIIKIMHGRGHVIVAAVGNGGPAAPALFPGAYPEVIAVTAVDSQGNVYRAASRGPQTMLAADGVNVAAVDARGTPRVVSGTSFAAPVASALLSRSISTLDPAAGMRALEELIEHAQDLGSPGWDPIYGHGWVGHGQ